MWTEALTFSRLKPEKVSGPAASLAAATPPIGPRGGGGLLLRPTYIPSIPEKKFFKFAPHDPASPNPKKF